VAPEPAVQRVPTYTAPDEISPEGNITRQVASQARREKRANQREIVRQGTIQPAASLTGVGTSGAPDSGKSLDRPPSNSTSELQSKPRSSTADSKKPATVEPVPEVTKRQDSSGTKASITAAPERVDSNTKKSQRQEEASGSRPRQAKQPSAADLERKYDETTPTLVTGAEMATAVTSGQTQSNRDKVSQGVSKEKEREVKEERGESLHSHLCNRGCSSTLLGTDPLLNSAVHVTEASAKTIVEKPSATAETENEQGKLKRLRNAQLGIVDDSEGEYGPCMLWVVHQCLHALSLLVTGKF